MLNEMKLFTFRCPSAFRVFAGIDMICLVRDGERSWEALNDVQSHALWAFELVLHFMHYPQLATKLRQSSIGDLVLAAILATTTQGSPLSISSGQSHVRPWITTFQAVD
jgi:hypothetical protein